MDAAVEAAAVVVVGDGDGYGAGGGAAARAASRAGCIGCEATGLAVAVGPAEVVAAAVVSRSVGWAGCLACGAYLAAAVGRGKAEEGSAGAAECGLGG